MNLLFLGTGAADFPNKMMADALYEIENKSIRRSTSTLLDGHILFDCGPHTRACLDYFGADVHKINTLMLTHFHEDHFNADVIAEIAAKAGKLDVYFSEDGKSLMPNIPNTVLHPIKVGDSFNVGEYFFTSHKANHTSAPCHYTVEKDGKRVFYGLDGAWICYDTFYQMRGKRYDVMILDATVGDYTGDYRVSEHNSIPMIRMMRDSFIKTGIADDETVIVLDHIARTLHKSHEDTCEKVEKDGFAVAYDGMKLTV